MPQVIGVTKAITNLNQAHQTFQLQPTTNPTFFLEWLESLPELSLVEIEKCDRLRTRYYYYQAESAITETRRDNQLHRVIKILKRLIYQKVIHHSSLVIFPLLKQIG